MITTIMIVVESCIIFNRVVVLNHTLPHIWRSPAETGLTWWDRYVRECVFEQISKSYVYYTRSRHFFQSGRFSKSVRPVSARMQKNAFSQIPVSPKEFPVKLCIIVILCGCGATQCHHTMIIILLSLWEYGNVETGLLVTLITCYHPPGNKHPILPYPSEKISAEAYNEFIILKSEELLL